MAESIVGICLIAVIGLYFSNNPLSHTSRFMFRRFTNWFPLGMSYAFLYMARYNLNVATLSLGSAISKQDFGYIFGVGTFVYASALVINGPLVDKIGGKRGILIACLGAAIFNGALGLATYLFMKGQLHTNLKYTLMVLYSLNMFFQSYGAVSIIKVKAYWFHVRERGTFGAIFGTLISFGIFFAFDWGKAIVDACKVHPDANLSLVQQGIRSLFAIDRTGTLDANGMVFIVPALILVFWAFMDVLFIKDTPDQAGFDKFDPADASSDEPEVAFSMLALLKKFFTNPVLLTVAAVEFTGGILRNGVMQWYQYFVKDNPGMKVEFFTQKWGLVMMVTGIAGGFLAGMISDRLFQSRRGPPAAIFSATMAVCAGVVAMTLFSAPWVVACALSLLVLAVIGVHSIMSGTAAADFGGRNATATASGITDAFVYIGSAVQSFSLGYLTTHNWQLWPIFLLPFAVLGCFLATRIWRDLPSATRRYIETQEKRSVPAGAKTIGGVLRV
jgi:OPA family glycerol-3-phosphate transporter-like MFS transporter